ncbi:MAG: hypothetical protein ABF274_09925 [Nonlabens sp.]|uniref:hypothetical protein n=1 Tax=Nonlabens sp. TaxID=1888209 RepID=UPI00321B55D8
MKQEIQIQKTIDANLTEENGPALNLKRFQVQKEERGVYYFENGNYTLARGESQFTKKKAALYSK